jgi:methionyl aminopeptidase
MNREKILQSGKIASEAREYARSFIKKGMPLIEIANKIESKMVDLGSRPAFPTCLSVNENAAHYTPSHDDETLAEGILKVDMGVHIDGWVADTAFSIDLENSDENKKIIKASEDALDAAIKTIKENIEIREIGKSVHGAIKKHGLNPIVNLSGHGIDQYDLHARVSIPNYDNKATTKITPGLYAIEPFATPGNGRVKDGNSSGILRLIDDKNPRSQIARDVLDFIIKEYETLPFASRWIVKEFGTKGLFGLKQLIENGNLQDYPVLIESSNAKVAQTEHSILVESSGVIVTTK